MAGDFIKCPRCELNYIRRNEEYCQVCKAELKIGPQLIFAIDEEDEDNQILCPRCKQNYIDASEKMCDQCREEIDLTTEKEVDMEKDEEWKNYVDEDQDLIPTIKADDEEMISLSQLQEEEDFFDDEEEEEDEMYYSPEPDDFDHSPIDESEFEDYEEEEEEEEDEEF